MSKSSDLDYINQVGCQTVQNSNAKINLSSFFKNIQSGNKENVLQLSMQKSVSREKELDC